MRERPTGTGKTDIFFTANGKREFLPRDDDFFLHLCFTVHFFYPKISNFTLVLTITIALDCF